MKPSYSYTQTTVFYDLQVLVSQVLTDKTTVMTALIALTVLLVATSELLNVKAMRICSTM